MTGTLSSTVREPCPIFRLSDVQQDNLCPLAPVLRDLPIGVIVADAHGRFSLFNREAERILGIGARQVDYAHWSSVYGCFLPDRVTPFPTERLPLVRALRGEHVRSELIFIRNTSQPNGVWIRSSSEPLANLPNEPDWAVVVFSDITQQKQALDRIELLSRAVEQTADSVLITDPTGVIQYVNSAFEATTGYTREEALGNTPRILKSGRHAPEFYRNLWTEILRGETFRGTLLNRKKTGALYWAEQTITPIKDNGGSVTQFVSVLKDITDSMRQQEHEIQLRLAGQVQQRLYEPLVACPGLDVGSAVYPAVETGGDYIDSIPMSDGSISIAVGDASGHGFDSALVMALTRAYVRAFLTQGSGVSRTLVAVNQMLSADLEGDRYVTLLLVQVNVLARTLSYASAGHVPGVLLDPSGRVELMESTGMPLGVLTKYKDACRTFELKPKTVILLLTDGVTEAESHDGSQFGVERAIDYLRAHQSEPARQIAQGICHAAQTFAGDQQSDDLAAVILKVD